MNDAPSPSGTDGTTFDAGLARPASRGLESRSPARSFADPPSRARRRGAVLAAYAGYAMVVGVVWVRARAGWPEWTLAMALVPGLAMLAGLAVLASRRAGIWDLANQPDEALDERQRGVRDRAYLSCYRVVAAVLILAAVYASLAPDLGWSLPRSAGARQALLWSAIFLTLTLPPATVAWTEPDAGGDDTGTDA